MNKEEILREISNFKEVIKKLNDKCDYFNAEEISDYILEILMYLKCDNLEMATDRVVECWKFMIKNNIKYGENA